MARIVCRTLIGRRRLRTGRTSCFLVLSLFWLLLPFGSPKAVASSYSTAGRVVLIDPGHGGKDPGASGHGVVEADVNLAVGRLLAEQLSRAGLVVVLTRTTTNGILGPDWHGKNRQRAELQARTGLGNAIGADAYLSIHCNFWPGRGKAVGAQVFLDERASRASCLLGEAIMENLRRGTNTRRQISRRIEHFVLENVRVPVVTVEMGFLSDPGEAVKLADPSYQRRIAHLIGQGVLTYLHAVPYADEETGKAATCSGRESKA